MDKKNRNILIALALLLGLFFFMRARRKTNEVDATMNAVTNGGASNTNTVNAPVESNLIVCYTGCPDSQASTHDVGISGNTCEDLGLLSVPPACANPNDADPCPQGMATARSTNSRGMQQSVCVGSGVADFDPNIDVTPSTILDNYPTLENFAEAEICPKLCTYWNFYSTNQTGAFMSTSLYANLQGFLTELNYFIEIAQSEYGVTNTPEQALNYLKEKCRKYTNTSLSAPIFGNCDFALVDNQTLADVMLVDWGLYGAGDQVVIPSIQAYEQNAIISNLGGAGVSGNVTESTTNVSVAEADLGGGFGNTNLGSGATSSNSVISTLGTSIPTALQTNLGAR